MWVGSLSDVRRLDVGSSEGTRYLIVRWKQKRMGIILGTFGTRAKAEAAGTQLLKLLGIDVPIGNSGSTNQTSART